MAITTFTGLYIHIYIYIYMYGVLAIIWGWRLCFTGKGEAEGKHTVVAETILETQSIEQTNEGEDGRDFQCFKHRLQVDLSD